MEKTPDRSPLTLVGSTATVLEPPRRLQGPGRSLWDRVQREFSVTDAGGIELLTLAGEALDRAERLSQAIERDGEIIRTKLGLRAHPGVREELANRSFVARTLQRLGITLEPLALRGAAGR
jgi:hypothetical protein